MDDLRKIHLTAGWLLTGSAIAMMLVNAVNATSLLCFAVGVALLAYAAVQRA
jgi:hypothetical protein